MFAGLARSDPSFCVCCLAAHHPFAIQHLAGIVAGPIPAIDIVPAVPVPFLSVIATIQQGREEKFANADYLRSYKNPTPGPSAGGRDEAGAS